MEVMVVLYGWPADELAPLFALLFLIVMLRAVAR